MNGETMATLMSAAPDLPGDGLNSLDFPGEAVLETRAFAERQAHREVNEASNADPAIKQDTAAYSNMNSQEYEVSSSPAPKTETAAASNVETNSHIEAPNEPKPLDDLLPQYTKIPHEPDGSLKYTNGHVTATSAHPKNNGISTDAIHGDYNGNSSTYPVALASVHQAESSVFPLKSDNFEDIWSPATKLKRRLEDTKDLIVCPGVYDGFSARIALSVGFDTMYMTGAGTTASRLGMADLGVASRTDMKEHADMIANLDPGKMLIADMDTGYGGPITITTTVNQYIRANVAGFHIEDQLLTKRCGHLAGKKVVSQDIYLSRVKAAKAAKDKARSDIVLIARTDANQQHGYDECLTRLRAARDTGADVGLLEGFKSKEEARRAVQDLAPWPLLLNVVENGHSPLITVNEARDMGFRIIIFSFGALVPAYLAIKHAFERLKTEGVTGVHETEISPRSIFDVCGLEEAMEIDEIAGGEDFKGGV